MPPRCAVLLTLTLTSAVAWAEEGEWRLGAEPTYALDHAGAALSGGGALLHLGYAPRDSLMLQLLGGVSGYDLGAAAGAPVAATLGAPGGALLGFSAGAGLVYVLDVVRVVPFFECWLGVLGRRVLPPLGVAAPETQLSLGLGVGFGADYLVSRRWSLGVAFRWAAALSDLDRQPLTFSAGPRISARFGL